MVTLLDVLKFAAEDFWKASQLIAEWRMTFPDPLSRADSASTAANLRRLVVHLYSLGLPVSVREFQKLEEFMTEKVSELDATPEGLRNDLFKPINLALPTRLEQIASVVHSELESKYVFALESDRVAFWKPDWLIDTPIYTAFPKAWAEFQNAGRCFAYGEPTSSVFHLMRVIDSGLRLVYASLGESYDARNWDGVAKKIEGEMSKKYQDKTVNWRAKEPFYSAVLTDIRSIGRAHRNPALHDLDRKYTDAEARYLIEVTKAFMQHLADNGMKETQ